MSSLRPGHQLELLQQGQQFFTALIAAIDAAAHEVRMETYIFDLEGAGAQVAQALVRAATRGVMVQLMMDGVGTPRLPQEWVQRFQSSGVQWHIFSPLGRLGVFIPSRWRRLHRKLCVVDGHVAFCGGINILDDWYDPNHGKLAAPRFDFAVQVRGPLVQAVHESVTQFWWRVQTSQAARQRDFAGTWRALQDKVTKALSLASGRSQAGTDAGSGALLQQTSTQADLVLRDNLRNRSRIERSYRKAIGEARSDIIIANAYFLPGRKLRQGLIHAARRGVRVRLMLQGRYEYFMQYHAARPVYEALLAAGVEIYEYSASFLHAKVAVIDGHWATVGSSNLDPLSLLLAREANVVVDDPQFAHDLLARLEQALVQDCTPVDPKAYANRPWRQRFLDRLALGMMRALLFLNGKHY